MEEKIAQSFRTLQIVKSLNKTVEKRVTTAKKTLKDGEASKRIILHQLLDECGPGGFVLCLTTFNLKEIWAKDRKDKFNHVKAYSKNEVLLSIAEEYQISGSVTGKYTMCTPPTFC